MATLQELTHRQINEAIQAATERNVPATVTIRAGQSWANLHSRLMALRDEHVLIAKPSSDDGPSRPEFHPADKIGLSFKLKHHKHIFTATVAGTERLGVDEQAEPLLSLCWPTRMHRLQRRAFLRVDVPPNRIIRASFWLGGWQAEPAGTSPDRPVWSGRVSNLSAGGFQLVASHHVTRSVEVGETVGLRLAFGAGRNTVYADAQLRHMAAADDEALIGFQFLGLAQTREGRQALHVISAQVAELQRLQNPRARRRGAS
jgi:c-di-GMP-binding flagellar brake protein YcgR